MNRTILMLVAWKILRMPVERGVQTQSSMSMPMVFVPLASSTPLTVNGILFMRIFFPSGSSSIIRFFATVAPIRQVLARLFSS